MQKSQQDNDAGAGSEGALPGGGAAGSSYSGGAGSSPDAGGPSRAPGRGTGGVSGGQNNDGRRELLRYAGLGSQVMASVGVSVYLGVKADKWLKVSFPILSWVLPLLVIVGLIVQLIKSSGKNNGK